MKLINDILHTLDLDVSVNNVCQGQFQTAVLTQNCGLAATPHKPEHHQSTVPTIDSRYLMTKDTSELAQMALSPNGFEASIGMATINSLLDIDTQYCTEINGRDLLIEKGKDKKIAIIGHFPFVESLRQVAKRLWVIEKHPQNEDFDESASESLVPQAEVVGITGSAFINHTIEHLLTICDTKAYVLILGPTTPISSVLFDYGVDAISGIKVVDKDMVLHYVKQGVPFRQIKGVQLLTIKKERR